MKRMINVIALLTGAAILVWVGYILWIKPHPDTRLVNPQPKTQAKDPLLAKGIDAETVTAYENLGAQYGGFVEVEHRIEDRIFRSGRDNAEKGVPAFSFP